MVENEELKKENDNDYKTRSRWQMAVRYGVSIGQQFMPRGWHLVVLSQCKAVPVIY